jgi:hypothetical protein
MGGGGGGVRLLVTHRPISHGSVCPLRDEARLLIDVSSRAIETTQRPQGRHHQLCTAVNSARCVDWFTQQLPVAVVSSPHRRFVLQYSEKQARPWSINVPPPM